MSQVTDGKLRLPVGNTSFKEAIEEFYYVDKTLLIKDIVDNEYKVNLITRPRRFGKTLNMDMLRTYFEKTENSNEHLFHNLKIWQAGEKYTSLQGKYPVIYLTFKDVFNLNWDDTYEKLTSLISREYLRHSYILDNNNFVKDNRDYFNTITNKTASLSSYENSLLYLTEFLYQHHGVRPIILIDEYDIPIQAGNSNGFYNEVISFMRNWMSSGFKDNKNLSFAVITGILKVAQESIFSGLNNLAVSSVLSEEYNTYFGFTEEEVIAMAEYYEVPEKMKEIKAWYDGYNFAGAEIYNPWSVINYFSHNTIAKSYWVSTSSNSTLTPMIKAIDFSTRDQILNLALGKSELVSIYSSIVYPKLEQEPKKIFSLLLHTGYLKVVGAVDEICGEYVCDVKIPNKEVLGAYNQDIKAYVASVFTGTNATLGNIQRSIVRNDVEKLNKSLNSLLLQSMSYMDAKSEAFYQGFMLCLGAMFVPRYELKENLEAGYGRFDLRLIPLQDFNTLPGILMEFKSLSEDYKSEEDLVAALKTKALEALDQISDKNYDVDIQSRGCKTILHYGIAFYGKRVHIESREILL